MFFFLQFSTSQWTLDTKQKYASSFPWKPQDHFLQKRVSKIFDTFVDRKKENESRLLIEYANFKNMPKENIEIYTKKQPTFLWWGHGWIRWWGSIQEVEIITFVAAGTCNTIHYIHTIFIYKYKCWCLSKSLFSNVINDLKLCHVLFQKTRSMKR